MRHHWGATHCSTSFHCHVAMSCPLCVPGSIHLFGKHATCACWHRLVLALIFTCGVRSWLTCWHDDCRRRSSNFSRRCLSWMEGRHPPGPRTYRQQTHGRHRLVVSCAMQPPPPTHTHTHTNTNTPPHPRLSAPLLIYLSGFLAKAPWRAHVFRIVHKGWERLRGFRSSLAARTTKPLINSSRGCPQPLPWFARAVF